MMTQPFAAPQGIPQHAGLPPGHHPMAQPQHPNAAHLGGQGAGLVQQMHPGVSAPAGPQASQGPMIGMPPGAGTTGPVGPVPNAHALSHLGPAPGHPIFQQQPFSQGCECIDFLSLFEFRASLCFLPILVLGIGYSPVHHYASMKEIPVSHSLPSIT
jgi:hypothetical protein